MNAYHVLAKITVNVPDEKAPGQVGVGSWSDQRHFFVKAASPSLAIGLVELRVQQPGEHANVQFTVKEATDHRSSGMAEGEEIYSL